MVSPHMTQVFIKGQSFLVGKVNLMYVMLSHYILGLKTVQLVSKKWYA
jgi:hypothetical protein